MINTKSIKYLTGISEVIIICLAAPFPRLIPHTRFLRSASHYPKAELQTWPFRAVPSYQVSLAPPAGHSLYQPATRKQKLLKMGQKAVAIKNGKSLRLTEVNAGDIFQGNLPNSWSRQSFSLHRCGVCQATLTLASPSLESLLCHVHFLLSQQP